MSKIALCTLSATERCVLSTKELLARFGQKHNIVINILSIFSIQILFFRVNSSLIEIIKERNYIHKGSSKRIFP